MREVYELFMDTPLGDRFEFLMPHEGNLGYLRGAAFVQGAPYRGASSF